MKNLTYLFTILLGSILSCNSPKDAPTKESKTEQTPIFSQKVVLDTDELKIIQLSEQVFQHISYLQTESFGNVECNGMIVISNGKAIVMDTPTNDQATQKLIQFLENDFNSTIKAVVSTHFHEDCIGGLDEFHKKNIASYASSKTISLLQNETENVPQNGFDKEMTLTIGQEEFILAYLGEGHTKDNSVVYFPKEKTLFGGCLLKEMNATKGYLGDANVEAWPETIRNLQNRFPDIQLVIPGHGKIGGSELLDYTIQLFKE